MNKDVSTIIKGFKEEELLRVLKFLYDCISCHMDTFQVQETIEKLTITSVDGIRPSFGVFPRLFSLCDPEQIHDVLEFALACWNNDITVYDLVSLSENIERRLCHKFLISKDSQTWEDLFS